MNEIEQIKGYYRPIQPAIKATQKDIYYQEVHPDPELSSYIYCLWQLKTTRPLDSPFIYRVVSDGCIDIFFEHKEPAKSFVMGFCRKYTEFPLGKEFDYIGIRFFPSMFPLLFGVNAQTISNQAYELQPILPRISEFIAHPINSTQHFSIVAKNLNEMFISETAQLDLSHDSRFYRALKLIFEKAGNLQTENDLSTGLSPRQLRRIFNYYIGTTPKTFSKVVRFQHILNAQPSVQSLKKHKVFYDAGFFDQAHFIKDFRTFYGVTPSQAFR